MKILAISLTWIILGVFTAFGGEELWAASKADKVNHSPANANEMQIFGPERFIRKKKKPITEIRNFAATQPDGQFTLKIINGDPDGKHRISSAIVSLNGERLASPDDFNQQVAKLEIPVTLRLDNQLSVQLRSKPGSYISISIESVSDPSDGTPPNISVSLDSASDSGLLGDGLTAQGQVILQGFTEANTPVSLYSALDPATAMNITNADDNGQYNFANVNLSLGANNFFVTATDDSGNTGRADVAIFQLPCDLDSSNFSVYFIEPDKQPIAAADSQLYMPDSNSFIGEFSTFGIPLPDQLVVMVGEMNGDLQPDVMFLPATGNEVLVFLNDGNVLSAPKTYNTGASQPTAIAVANFVGDVFPDIAIGHADGNLSFLEGDGQGNFTLMPDMILAGLGGIVDLVSADFDGDSDADLGISGGDQIHVLRNDDDVYNAQQLVNGYFNQGLNGWLINIKGHKKNALPGSVTTHSGAVVLTENTSFRTTLKQTFKLSMTPQVLSFDVLSINLDVVNGGIPDAFEVSLLTENNQSVVPTIDPLATAFFNVNPNGIVSSAPGVTYVDGKVSLDISAVPPGTQVTLYFDVIGNPPGQGSSVTIANINAGDGVMYINSFSHVPVAGPFISSAGVTSCDANSDNLLDLLISDPGQDSMFIYEQDDEGGFSRSQQLPLGGL